MSRKAKEMRVNKLRELIPRSLSDGRSIDLDVLYDLAIHLYPDVQEAAVKNAIRSDLRTLGEDGLPFALSVDNHGTFMQLALMEVEEFRFAIVQYMTRSAANRARAFALAEKCRDKHGVWLDPDVELRNAAL